jgi:adenylosuccinate lyase
MDRSGGVSVLSPLDGRYASKTGALREYFSEEALIRYRVRVEVTYLVYLIEFLEIKGLGMAKKKALVDWVQKISLVEVERVMAYEKKTRHDVKAVEYMIGERLGRMGLDALVPWVHWGLTSEDTNNLAYGMMVRDGFLKVLFPLFMTIEERLLEKAEKEKGLVMAGRTHGQVAVPTTMGKEWMVFADRMMYWLEVLESTRLTGKLNGAVGNFNGMAWVYPDKDWVGFSQKVIKALGLEPQLISTQIEPGDRLAHFLYGLRGLLNVLEDLAQDVWFYIALDLLVQKRVEEEVGSSTMPQKVNPIWFENAEGNIQLAKSLLITIVDSITRSRLQRDLSDSTVKRNIGSALGYVVVAGESLVEGLDRVEVDPERMMDKVREHPEVLSEGLQLYLKSKGVERGYERVKETVRTQHQSWGNVVARLPGVVQSEVRKWKPEEYVGLAEKLVNMNVTQLRKKLDLLKEKL